MPTICKLKSGHYQVIVRVKGAKAEYKKFRHKNRASAGAKLREKELKNYILNGDGTAWRRLTVAMQSISTLTSTTSSKKLCCL